MLAGVPRCTLGNFEGGELMGTDVANAIRYFGERGKIWKVHMPNMSAPLPHFVETFVDNGYYDISAAMRALRETNFDGTIIGGHFPTLVGGPRMGVTYTVAWIRAMIERANAEAGIEKA